MKKKISIVTPNLNGGKYLEQTIQSVIDQSCFEEIEYIVVDGESKDNSHEILRKYEKYIDVIKIRKDNNMYEAIDYGFSISNSDILCWINSDDFFLKNTIKKIIDKINLNNYQWVNCRASSLKNNKLFTYPFPFYFPRSYIYDGKCHKSEYGFIPQESVFFKRELYLRSKGIIKNYKQSGDYYLWREFAKYADLNPINLKAGVFRKRKNQLTEDPTVYYSEIKKNLNQSLMF